jgi:hypothetical protein
VQEGAAAALKLAIDQAAPADPYGQGPERLVPQILIGLASEQLAATIDREVAQRDFTGALPAAEKRARAADLQKQVAEVEQAEEQAVRQAEATGIAVLRRPDVDGALVLGLRAPKDNRDRAQLLAAYEATLRRFEQAAEDAGAAARNRQDAWQAARTLRARLEVDLEHHDRWRVGIPGREDAKARVEAARRDEAAEYEALEPARANAAAHIAVAERVRKALDAWRGQYRAPGKTPEQLAAIRAAGQRADARVITEARHADVAATMLSGQSHLALTK